MGKLVSDETSKKLIKEVISKLKKSHDIKLEPFRDKLKKVKAGEDQNTIRPYTLFCHCVLNIVRNEQLNPQSYLEILNYGEEVYRTIFPMAEESVDFEYRSMVFLELFEKNGSVTRKNFNYDIFNLFRESANYLKWYMRIALDKRFAGIEKECTEYGMMARSYFGSEDTFTANYIYVSQEMMDSENPSKVLETEMKNVEHMAGIYDVDEALIMEAEQKIMAARDSVDRAQASLEMINQKIKTITQLTESAVDRVKRICDNEIGYAVGQIDDADARLRKSYEDFLETQREGVLMKKDQLVNDVISETNLRLADIKKELRRTLDMAKLELSDINRESDRLLEKAASFRKDDEFIKGFLKKNDEQEKLAKKLEKIMLLNDKSLDILAEHIQKQADEPAEENVSAATENEYERNREDAQSEGRDKGYFAAVNGKKGAGKGGQNSPINAGNSAGRTGDSAGAANRAGRTGEVMGSQTYADIPGIIPVSDEYDEIPEVCPLLNEDIDFQERLSRVMHEKQKREEAGVHFHKMFDDVIVAVMENANPYLIGPSGCGKTYMVSQIADILGVGFVDIGYINEEYDILGFQTANGGYSRPNFYRCYKYGKIAFCDELDNGNSRATVKLNSFLSNTVNAGYSFPNGEHVNRHGNFRIIAAGNTSGNGADSIYNTREKIEESVQQRFTPIYVGYDNGVEKSILGPYDDWYSFVILFREATDSWSRTSHSAAPGIITTRDATRIRKYLDNGSFSAEKIIDYEFIQTKDDSYLAFLADYMKNNCGDDNPGIELITEFCNKVELIRNGDIVR